MSHVPGRLLVRFRPGTSLDTILAATVDLEVDRELQAIGVYVLTMHDEDLPAVEERLRQHPAVETVERDGFVTGQLAVNDPGSTFYLDPHEVLQSFDYGAGSHSVVIAGLDTGVRTTHEDLVGNLVDSSLWRNFVNANTVADDHGHGTRTLSLFAMVVNNSLGQPGTSYNCAALPIKVLGSNNAGTWADTEEGIIYAADAGAKVMCLSLGATSAPTSVHDAVKYAAGKGCLVVAAAGNTNGSTLFYPAAYDEVMGVTGMVTDTNTIDGTKGYGLWVDVAAGSFQTSAYWTSDTDYGTWSGSSASTPVVAGTAGLIFAIRPALMQHQVRALIHDNADPMAVEDPPKTISGGRFNARKAVEAASLLPAAPTAAVTGLAAAGSGTTVEVTWNAVAGVTSYVLRRSDTAGAAGRLIVSYSITTTSYTDTVTDGALPFYTVAPLGEGGEGPEGQEVQAAEVARTVSAWSAPVTSTTLAAVAGTVGSVLPILTQQAVGVSTVPSTAGATLSTLPLFAQSATGTVIAPEQSGAIISTLLLFDQAASGTVTSPSSVGTIVSTLLLFDQSAVGTVTAPTVTGTITSVLPLFVSGSVPIISAWDRVARTSTPILVVLGLSVPSSDMVGASTPILVSPGTSAALTTPPEA